MRLFINSLEVNLQVTLGDKNNLYKNLKNSGYRDFVSKVWTLD